MSKEEKWNQAVEELKQKREEGCNKMDEVEDSILNQTILVANDVADTIICYGRPVQLVLTLKRSASYKLEMTEHVTDTIVERENVIELLETAGYCVSPIISKDAEEDEQAYAVSPKQS